MKRIYLHILTFSIFINLTLAENVPNEIDPISWIIGHKDKWNQSIILKKPLDFPIQNNGKIIGSLKKNTGTEVKIESITNAKVIVLFNGYTASVPIEDTNLIEIAKSMMEKSKLDNAETVTITNNTTEQLDPSGRMGLSKESIEALYGEGVKSEYTENSYTYNVNGREIEAVYENKKLVSLAFTKIEMELVKDILNKCVPCKWSGPLIKNQSLSGIGIEEQKYNYTSEDNKCIASYVRYKATSKVSGFCEWGQLALLGKSRTLYVQNKSWRENKGCVKMFL